MEIGLYVAPVSRSQRLQTVSRFQWQGCSWRGGGEPREPGSQGARLPTVGGDSRCSSPALQASRTSFPTNAQRVRTCSPSGLAAGSLAVPGASHLWAPAPACPSAWSALTPVSACRETPTFKTQLKSQPCPEAAAPLSGPGLALPSPSLRLPVCPWRSTLTTAPCGHVSPTLWAGLPQGLIHHLVIRVITVQATNAY